MSITPESLRQLLHVFLSTGVCDLATQTESIKGFLSTREGVSLYFLAAFGAGQGEIVEIGSFQGKSTVWLARGSKDAKRERVWAIDPHLGSPEHQVGEVHSTQMPRSGSTFEDFQESIRRFDLEAQVSPLVETSNAAAERWSAPIRLLFIDGLHDFESVEQDFLSWTPYLVPGGLVAFHDVCEEHPGPGKVIAKHISGSQEYTPYLQTDSLFVAAKNG